MFSLLQGDQRGQLPRAEVRAGRDGVEQHRLLQSNLTRSLRRRSGDSVRSRGGTVSYEEIDEADVDRAVGSNAREAHPIFFHHLMKGLDNGARMYCVDPRRTSSAKFADVWLGIDVGTDIALANALAREIIHAGLTDEAFIATRRRAIDEFAAAVEPYTLEVAADITGVPGRGDPRDGARLRRRRQVADPVDARHHRTPQRRRQRRLALQPRAAHRPRRPLGSGLVPLRGQNNVQGGGDMGALPNKFPGFQDVDDPAPEPSSSGLRRRSTRSRASTSR